MTIKNPLEPQSQPTKGTSKAATNESAKRPQERPQERPQSADTGLSINEQASNIAQNSAKASYGSGENLAIASAQHLVQGYLETTSAITAVVAEELGRAHEGFAEALESATVTGVQRKDKESFLKDFRQALQSRTGLTQ